LGGVPGVVAAEEEERGVLQMMRIWRVEDVALSEVTETVT